MIVYRCSQCGKSHNTATDPSCPQVFAIMCGTAEADAVHGACPLYGEPPRAHPWRCHACGGWHERGRVVRTVDTSAEVTPVSSVKAGVDERKSNMHDHDLKKFPNTLPVLKTLLAALAADGIMPAGLVLCAVPVRGEIAVEPIVFTALRDDARFDMGEGIGLAPQSASVMALYEQATRGIRRRIEESGS